MLLLTVDHVKSLSPELFFYKPYYSPLCHNILLLSDSFIQIKPGISFDVQVRAMAEDSSPVSQDLKFKISLVNKYSDNPQTELPEEIVQAIAHFEPVYAKTDIAGEILFSNAKV